MNKTPSLRTALTPVIFLLSAVVAALLIKGSDFVADYSYLMLLGGSAVALIVGIATSRPDYSKILDGLRTSARQTLPAVPILLLIGTVSATWMLSGVVPALIEVGLKHINPPLFLLTTCCTCAFIALLSGSSWTTIATMGIAFMGIGTLLGFSPGWIAGAIISGAYFGDKMSPLSDTTVLAATASRVNLFIHIRYMLITTVPSLVVTMLVFTIAGLLTPHSGAATETSMIYALKGTFNMSPFLFLIPGLTALLILLRVNTLLTLAASTLFGVVGIVIFQPTIMAQLDGDSPMNMAHAISRLLVADTSILTGDDTLDSLIATGGMKGMLPTVWLILSAMVFGGVMIGTGLLGRITHAFTKLLHNRVSAVGATAASGLFLNSATADQYLSIIIGSNMYGSLYSRLGLEGRLLSRTLEDSVSVTSVLIPWNSCGVTQSAILGVSTLTYLPYCVFNYLSPIMSLFVAITGFKIIEIKQRHQSNHNADIKILPTAVDS